MNNEIEYLKEHLYEIYKYKKSMKDLTYDMDIEHLSRTCKALNYLQNQLQQKENIIKEIREYIKYQLEHLDFEKDTKAKMLGAMVLVMLDEGE